MCLLLYDDDDVVTPLATFISMRSHTRIVVADNEHIRLEEDITLAGFTPLFCNVPMEIYCHRDVDKEIAQVSGYCWLVRLGLSWWGCTGGIMDGYFQCSK